MVARALLLTQRQHNNNINTCKRIVLHSVCVVSPRSLHECIPQDPFHEQQLSAHWRKIIIFMRLRYVFFLRCCCCCCAHKTRWIKQNMSAAWQPDTSGFFAPTEIPLYIYERATMNERQSQKKQNKDAQENETFFCCFLFCVIWWDEYMRLSLVANEEKKCVHHKKLEVIQVIRRNAVASMSLYTAWMPQKY